MKWNLTAFNGFLILAAIILGLFFYITKVFYWEIIDVLVYPEFFANSYHVNTQQSSEILFIKQYFASYIQNINPSIVDYLIEKLGYDFYESMTILFSAIAVTSLLYLLFNKYNYVSITSVIICFVFFIVVVVLDSTVTKKTVDSGFSKFNYQDVAGLNYIKLLRKEKYQRLDDAWRGLNEQFHKGEITEQQYEFEFDKFEDIKKEDFIYLQRWITVSKIPEIPLSVRGVGYQNLGWNERGYKFAKDTSEEQFNKMRQYFRKSIEDHNASLKLNKRMLFSYLSMLDISRASALLDSKEIFMDAVIQFPASILLNYRYMLTIEPKWGGSFLEMSEHAITQRKYVAMDPKLISLSGYDAVYKADGFWHEKDYDNAIKWYKRALLFGARSSFFNQLNKLYVFKKDYKNAITMLDEGLKHHPKNQFLLVSRAVNNAQLKNLDAAIIDADAASEVYINEYWLMGNLAWVYQYAGDNKKAVEFYIKTLALNPDHVYALQRLYYLSYLKAVSYKKVLPYMKHWVYIKPDSSEAWISYANTIEDLNPRKSKYAYEKYLLLVDRDNSNNLNAIKEVEAYLVKQDISKVE